MKHTDVELVNDAYLEVMSDPDKYSIWTNEFVTNLKRRSDNPQKYGMRALSKRQREILTDIITEV